MFSHTISHEPKWRQLIQGIKFFSYKKISICGRVNVHLNIFQIMKKVLDNNSIEHLDIHPSLASLVIDFEHVPCYLYLYSIRTFIMSDLIAYRLLTVLEQGLANSFLMWISLLKSLILALKITSMLKYMLAFYGTCTFLLYIKTKSSSYHDKSTPRVEKSTSPHHNSTS